MSVNKKSQYLLFGNPVHHSKSPVIYDFFSKNMNVNFNYDVQCIEQDMFTDIVLEFFQTYGQGANITVPFKEAAYKLSHIVTRRAQITNSVNVLKKIGNKILGDNTDGIGFLHDLKRLNFINVNQKVLIIGAGGAARGIVPNLLSLNCSIHIVNRTFSRASYVASCFKKFGNIEAMQIDSLKFLDYHLIINATSAGMQEECDFFISHAMFYPGRTVFYDLYYNNRLTPFLTWCRDHGGIYYTDGIGMLVSQAAYSFYLWHGVFPDINCVIDMLNKNKEYSTY